MKTSAVLTSSYQRRPTDCRRSLALLAVSSAIVGWTPAPTGQRFRAETTLVALHATVRGSDGRLVADLSREAFEVLDDGVITPIRVFSNEVQPITAVLMADVSSSISVAEVFGRLRDALRYFVRSLRPGDRVRIGTFGKEIALGHALTENAAELERVIDEEIWPGGMSPVWRATDAALRSIELEPGRQVIVMLTDGVDAHGGGLHGIPSLPGGLGALRRRAEASANLLIYAVGLGRPWERQRLSAGLISLVRATGGGHIELAPNTDLGQTLQEVGEELRRQYVVGFTPRHRDGKLHGVRLRVASRGATIRTRENYLAPGR
jgi:Ca-activated chloride channel family protein